MINIEKYIADNVWKGLDVLRGYLDVDVAQGVFKELLFIKLLNDELKKENKYFTDRIDGVLDFDKIINNYEEFFNELDKFISSNEILNGLLVDIYRLKDTKEYRLLGQSIHLLNQINNDNEVESGVLFRYFLDLTLKSRKVEVTTSLSINLLIRELLACVKMESIYDPTIGTSNLIVEVASKHENVQVYGQDINNDMIRTCKMLLILDKRIDDVFNIYQGNTIVNPGNIEEGQLQRFDCIVCNPPFGLKDWGYNEVANFDKYNRFHRGLPSKSLADYAFITHVVESLSDSGIAIMIEPSGVLFREGAEGSIREKLIQENIIDCIISLPNNMMYGTALPVNLIIFNKMKSTEETLFIDLTKEAEVSKILTTFTEETICKISNVYNQRLEIDGLSRKVNIDEIKANNWNLNVQRYIEIKTEREELDGVKICYDIEKLQARLMNIQSEIKNYFDKKI
ncbi:SAM-dependent methyltransferase [Clostridium gasigenes]|uniref:N-6 DNA methylase n=1 Tax=Clostridium gasigenes TaxID=94869 RepID=UPI001C0CCCC8|nr:N-6 DNA methylase [Clostridium gasigenes]MBU3135576.1 SAM-dependent methyltransferase [Clostridium gasigenes]